LLQQVDTADPILPVEKLYAIYYPMVLSFCRSRLRGDRAAAEDLAQEVFARALKYELRGDPKPWLFTVASRLVGDELKRRSKSRALEEGRGVLDRAADPQELVVDRQIARSMLRALTPAERGVIGQTLLADQSHEAAGRALGIRASTSRVLQSRALSKLRKISLGGAASVVMLVQAVGRRFRRDEAAWEATLSRAAAVIAGGVALGLVVGGLPGGGRSGQSPATRITAPGGAATGEPASRIDRGALGGGQVSAAATAPAPRSPGRLGLSGLLFGGPPLQQNAMVYDLEPSPTYDQDRTVYFAGLDAPCAVTCLDGLPVPRRVVLFRSTDGAAESLFWLLPLGSGHEQWCQLMDPAFA
jgi:RNA polymerase sigma-70 factor, ECF subfamily